MLGEAGAAGSALHGWTRDVEKAERIVIFDFFLSGKLTSEKITSFLLRNDCPKAESRLVTTRTAHTRLLVQSSEPQPLLPAFAHVCIMELYSELCQ